MARAVWNDTVLAESDNCEEVEGNLYFPADSIRTKHFKPSSTQSLCPWKGTASYYTLEVDGRSNPDAAWFYPDPLPAAEKVRGRVAFWKGVRVEP